MRKPAPRQDRIFFGLAGLWFVLLTFVGFSPTFFLRNLPDPLPTNQVLHGVVYSAWILLFLIQALLVSARRLRLHMLLGSASVLLLVAMIPIGFNVVLVKTAAGLKSVDGAGFNLTSLSLGFAFAFAAIIYRKRSFVHKRLMLFSAVMLTIAAADRVASIVGLEEIRLVRKGLAVTPGVAVFWYDALVLRRFPLISASLLSAVWVVIWFLISDLVFLRSIGETIIAGLTTIFVW